MTLLTIWMILLVRFFTIRLQSMVQFYVTGHRNIDYKLLMKVTFFTDFCSENSKKVLEKHLLSSPFLLKLRLKNLAHILYRNF